jgi:ubiquinone biosynthesis protein UbiJ
MPAAVAPTPSPTSAASEKNGPSLAERIHQLRDQAEQLAQELEKLEKEAVKK